MKTENPNTNIAPDQESGSESSDQKTPAPPEEEQKSEPPVPLEYTGESLVGGSDGSHAGETAVGNESDVEDRSKGKYKTSKNTNKSGKENPGSKTQAAIRVDINISKKGLDEIRSGIFSPNKRRDGVVDVIKTTFASLTPDEITNIVNAQVYKRITTMKSNPRSTVNNPTAQIESDRE